jgi:hypothetical protein
VTKTLGVRVRQLPVCHALPDVLGGLTKRYKNARKTVQQQGGHK